MCIFMILWQVKVEDFNVKEEPEDWPQTEASENSQMFGFSDPGLAYLAHASNLPVRAQGSAVMNQIATTQSQAPAAELQSHPLPGPSGIQTVSVKFHLHDGCLKNSCPCLDAFPCLARSHWVVISQ